eukprot:TRINITY_DN2431_c0_g1_i1.p1 TRINITY_DN2431_c0_g1~~TRINITY_DN2431_c0_g1_i1.p1  ORF type:complete len:1522 (-),score=421.17 TRINITY_DN2431_c0_g1_i1:56-4120(-)
MSLKQIGMQVQQFAAVLKSAREALDSPLIADALRAMPDLSLAASEWMQQHQFAELAAYVQNHFTASGYGYLQQIPMLYLAKFIHMAQMTGLPRLWTIEGGYATLWHKVAASLHTVRTGVQIEAIQRRDGQVFVLTSSGEHLVGDKLIVATSAATFMQQLDLTVQERFVFNRLQTLSYWTSIVRCDALPKSGFYLLQEECSQAPLAGSARCVSYHHRYEDTNVCLFYSFGESQHAVEEAVRQVVHRMQGTVIEMIQHYQWKYFPHFSSEWLDAGVLDRLQQLQGSNMTLFLGSMNNFELVEPTLQSTRALIEQHFAVVMRTPAAFVEMVQKACARVSKYPVLPHQDQLFAHMQTLQLEPVLAYLRIESGLPLTDDVFEYNTTPRILGTFMHQLQNQQHQLSASGPLKPSTSTSSFLSMASVTPSASNDDALLLLVQQQFASAMQLNDDTLPDADTVFIEMGLDSLQLAQVVLAISTATNVALDIDTVLDCSTARMLAQAIRKLQGDNSHAAQTQGAHLGVRSAPAVIMTSDKSTAQHLTVPVSLVPSRPISPASFRSAETTASASSASVYRKLVNIVYRVHEGHAFMLDVYLPTGVPRNGAAFVQVGSAGWQGGDYLIGHYENSGVFHELCKLGFCVFALRLGTSENDSLAQIVESVSEAIRWVKRNARDYAIQRDRVILTGMSAGAHLALCSQILCPDEEGRATALALFCPAMSLGVALIPWEKVLHCQKDELPEYMKRYSPATMTVQRALPPTRIYHARYDQIIMLSEVEAFSKQLLASGTMTELIVRDVEGHPWLDIRHDFAHAGEWVQSVLPYIAPRVDDFNLRQPLVNVVEKVQKDFLQKWQHEYRQQSHGADTTYNVLWLLRCQDPTDSAKPAFPELLPLVVSLQDDARSRTTHAYNNFVLQLMFANTLLQWNNYMQQAWTQRAMTAVVEALLYRSMWQHEDYQAMERSYGRFFSFAGNVGTKLAPAFEAELLLRQGAALLSPSQCAVLQRLADELERWRGPIDTAEHFDGDTMTMHFAEHFTESALRSDSAIRHMARTRGVTIALRARYYNLHLDLSVLQDLRHWAAQLQRGSWFAQSGMFDDFALMYLTEAGLDCPRYLADTIQHTSERMSETGTPVHLHTTSDCDATALLRVVCSFHGTPCRMPTRHLQTWWNDETQSYGSADAHGRHCISTLASITEAYMLDNTIPYEEKLAQWQRMLGKLASATWQELYHTSPFYPWERIVVVLSSYAHLFAQESTEQLFDCVRQILAAQDSYTGGFASVYLQAPNVEETAFAVKALKSFARIQVVPVEAELMEAVRGAIGRGVLFLKRRLEEGLPDYVPDMWSGKMGFCPMRIVEAVILSALL